jgi:hypothetical protein
MYKEDLRTSSTAVLDKPMFGEQPVIKFEKLPVLAPSFPPQRCSRQPRKRDFPGPSKGWKRGYVESVG